MTLLRSFTLRTPELAADMVRYVKAHAGEAARIGQPLQVTVARYKPPRTPGSNRFMWAAVLQPIADQVCVADRYFSAETWNEHLKAQFLPELCAAGVEKWVVFPNGDRMLAMSTTHLNTEEMGLYLEAVQAHAATELGVVFPDRPAT